MISTKKILEETSGSISKTLNPGNQKIMVTGITITEEEYQGEKSYKLVYDCEGEDLGSSFVGFFIDRDNESLGRHKGAVGRVKSSKWNHKDKTFADGNTSTMEDQILASLKVICVASKCDQWLADVDGKYQTIQELVFDLNEAAPFKGVFFNACLSAKEYNNKSGYTNYDLFLGKGSKTLVHAESLDVSEEKSMLHTYNEVDDLQRKKEIPPALTEFSTNDEDDELGF